MAYPLLGPSKRENRRKMENEFRNLGVKLGSIEERFANKLFSSGADYLDVYKEFLSKYSETANKMKAKYISINPYYFRIVYKPDIHIRVFSFLHKLHNFFRARALEL